MKRPLEQAHELLRSTFPEGRFFRHAPIEAGRFTHEQADQQFVLVSIYEHRLSTHFREVGGWPFIITNGFLSSHAYNLALVWLWHRAGSRAGPDALKVALRHNYKKFYAEAALGERNCLIGRAMLIETLLDQDEVMEPIFADASMDPVLTKRVGELQSVTGQIASHHEAGHYFISRGISPVELSGELLEGLARPAVTRLRTEAGPQLAEEVLCDLLALNFAIHDETTALADYPRLTRLRIAVLAFLLYGDLATLGFSARFSARQSHDVVALGSELRSKEPIDLVVVRQPDLARRTDVVLEVAADLAAKWGGALFGADDIFSLPPEVQAILADTFDHFMEARVSPGPPPATSRAGMARLLAEALHGHDAGAAHLLWRSKQFLIGGEPLDP
ncbi:MAG TPA: hypothetical protein VGB04_13545 [Allosphingosinicella sp.]|jgi:hypothetical protein